MVHVFQQRSGIDFDKTSALLVSIAAVRLTLADFRGSAGTSMKHLDVTTVFLASKVNEELYETLPNGVLLLEVLLGVSSGTQVQVSNRRLKIVYILKHVTLNWFETLDNFFLSIKLQGLKAELGINTPRGEDMHIRKAVQAWVDDMIFFSDSDGSVERSLQQ